jgi:hypothetical protein
MLIAGILLFLQAPAISEGASEALTGEVPRTLRMSAGGSYLVLGMEDRLEIRDAQTLKMIRTLPTRWTAFGFDERDSELLIVGDDAVRLLSKDWSERYRQPLPDARFSKIKASRPEAQSPEKRPPLLADQALITPELDFFYRTGGGIAKATWTGAKLESTPVALQPLGGEQVNRLFAISADGSFLLTLEGEELTNHAAIGHSGKIVLLNGCSGVLGVGMQGALAAFVGSEEETLFDSTTWKAVARRPKQSNRSVAFNPKTGWFFVAGPKGLRSWSIRNFGVEKTYSEFPGPVSAVEVDASRSTLFTIEGATLRRWSIKD